MTTDGHTDTKCNERFSKIELAQIEIVGIVASLKDCTKETKEALNKILGILDGFHEFQKRTYGHMDEGEKPGGIRDRIKDIESSLIKKKERLDRIEKSILYNAIVGGIIGGFIVLATPETFNLVFKILGILK